LILRIRSISLTLTARFCKENPKFFPIGNPVLPPQENLYN
jgi:hypothetical protein